VETSYPTSSGKLSQLSMGLTQYLERTKVLTNSNYAEVKFTSMRFREADSCPGVSWLTLSLEFSGKFRPALRWGSYSTLITMSVLKMELAIIGPRATTQMEQRWLRKFLTDSEEILSSASLFKGSKLCILSEEELAQA